MTLTYELDLGSRWTTMFEGHFVRRLLSG